MLCLHCSPPTSDPRGTRAEGPHSLLTDIKWTPGVSSDSPETDGRPPGSSPKATEGSPVRPGDPRTETPAQQAQVSRDGPGAHVATERHTLAEEPGEYDPHPRQPSRARPAAGQPAHTTATTSAPPEAPITTLHHPAKHGEEEPPVLSRDPPSPPDGQTERAPRGTPGPRRLGPAAQHWTAYVWMRQQLRGIRSAPKAVLAHAAPARGHRPCVKAGATKRALLTPEYSLHCCIRRQMHKGCRGVLRPARRNCSQTVRCEVRRYSWSVS